VAKRIPDEKRREIVEIFTTGVASMKEIAKSIGYTEETVRRIIVEARKKGEAPPAATDPPGAYPGYAPPPAHMAAPTVELEPVEIPDEDSLTAARRMLYEAERRAKVYEQQGNYAAAQKTQRDAAAFMNIVARLEKAQAASGDAVVIPRAQIEAKMMQLKDRIRSMQERPLLCKECNRKLSIEWGDG